MSEPVAPDCEDDVCSLPGAASLVVPAAPIAADVEIPANDLDAFQALAADRGWGDGLPLVPPTEARVEAFLEALPGGVDADEVVAVLPPRGGLATRRLLAVNAVMAGASPELGPVLTSAIRALAEPEINLRGVNATTHPVAPLAIVHGPAAQALGFNAGLGAFGPGNRANATLGRAIRLVMMHVAGARPGDGDASTQGQPSKYAYCVAENAAESPWAPYPTTRGLGAASNAVTVACGENPHNVQDHDCKSAEHTLEMIASTMAQLGSNNAPVSSAEWFVFLGPEHADAFASAGYARDDVQRFLFEQARLPMGHFRRVFDVTQYAEWEYALGDDDPKPIMRSPDLIHVMVVGGAGKHSCVMPSWGMTASVMRPIIP